MFCVNVLLVPKCAFANVLRHNLLVVENGHSSKLFESLTYFSCFTNYEKSIMPKSKKSKRKGHVNQEIKSFDTCHSRTSPVKATFNNLQATTKKCTKPLDACTSSKAISKDSVHSSNTNVHVKKKKTKRKATTSQDSTLEITKSISKLNIGSDAKHLSKSVTNKKYYSHSAGSNKSTKLSIDTLEDVARYILANRAKKIVVMAGAGISTASGIPDFRTPGTGLYDNLQRFNIPKPTAVFDLDYFHERPKPFFELAKELYPSGKYRPNIAHYFLRSLHEKGLLLRLYTQNIDGLERLAGIPPQKLVEAHGTFATASCTKCGKRYNGDAIKHKILKGVIPRCELTPLCWGIVKPDIVFFGEDLPKRFYYYVKDFPQCDLLIVMGTSLEVEPFASLVDSVRFHVPRLLLNRNKVGPFKSRGRPTDLAVTGDIVDSISRFSTILGWKKFVNETMEDHELASKIEKEDNDSSNSTNRTDSGISSASSTSSDRKDSAKSLPPVDTSNIKRYFHTIRSTPLPKPSCRADHDNDPGDTISGVSYYDYIRSMSKRQNRGSEETTTVTSSSGLPSPERPLRNMHTLAKARVPTICYTQTVVKRKDKMINRRLSNHSMPALNSRKSGVLDLSDESQSDSDSSESVSSGA